MKNTQMIGKAVKRRRDALGLSQRDLAAKAETTAAAVSHIERGQRQPSADLLGRLASALECSTDDLFSADPSPAVESLYLDRVTSAMKSFPASVQEEVAEYCAFLKHRRRKGPHK